MSRKVCDYFFRKAKNSGLLARSAYKLEEIQQRYSVLSKGGDVLDLGCSPGAWLQVAAKYTSGRLVGVDLKEVLLPLELQLQRLQILQKDARTLTKEDLTSLPSGFHTVLSDMCHSTIGIASADAARSLDLAETAAALSLGTSYADAGDAGKAQRSSNDGLLLPGGNLVIKLLEGSGTAEFAAQLQQHFCKLKHVRPKATRQESREIYLLGLSRQC